MKIALLAPGNVIHTVRWANGLASRGHEVHVISAHGFSEEIHASILKHALPYKAPLGYFLNYYALRSKLSAIKPDILNTHFASGYGTLSGLAQYSPTLLSVWGSDVYDFPQKSAAHSWLIKQNLRRADAIGSTSHTMLKVTNKIFHHELSFVTPFGVDVDRFNSKQSLSENHKVVIGTVKTLETKYGIDLLIQSFHQLSQLPSMKDIELELKIFGVGSEELRLKQLAETLGVNVFWGGWVEHAKVPDVLNGMDIYAALSRLDSESFGVAIIEASACELAVVVSDADGPSEVVLNGETGFIVPKESVSDTVNALEKLVLNEGLRKRFGQQGRVHVVQNYSWSSCLETMESAMFETIELSK